MEISTCRTPWRVLIANGRFFEENYRRGWKQHNMTNKELQGNLPKIYHTICESWVRFSGHWWRSKEAHQLMWEPSHGKYQMETTTNLHRSRGMRYEVSYSFFLLQISLDKLLRIGVSEKFHWIKFLSRKFLRLK